MKNLYISGRLRICPKTVLHVKRYLPGGKGAISVMLRQEVTPSDILGEGLTSSGFHTINLSKELGVSPKKAPQYLKKEIGQMVYQGELLAQKEGLIRFSKKNILVPQDGVLDYYDAENGNLRIRLVVKKNKLASGVYGIIDRINQEEGAVIIRTQATVIYGILGSGKEREGNIKIVSSADGFVNENRITDDLGGKIIVGGSLIFPNVLTLAMEAGVLGFIAGGINVADYKSINGGKIAVAKQWSDIGTTVLITEGFGMTPIGEDIFSILKSHDNRFAVVDGNNKRMILPTNKPESMIDTRRTKLPEEFFEKLPEEFINLELKAGIKVRVLSRGLLGMQGVVESIDQTETRLPSGIMTYLVTVIGQKKVRVPYQNLEMI